MNKPRTILPTESTFPTGQPNVNATQSLPAVNLSVDSLIKLAMGQDIPENLEGLILPKSLNIERTPSERGHVRTEEIDSGIAPRHAEKTVKLVQSLNDAEKHLESAKQDVVEQSVDLLDNLKSSEDEDPFKFLSPSHIPSFPPEGWLNEEVWWVECAIKLVILKQHIYVVVNLKTTIHYEGIVEQRYNTFLHNTWRDLNLILLLNYFF